MNHWKPIAVVALAAFGLYFSWDDNTRMNRILEVAMSGALLFALIAAIVFVRSRWLIRSYQKRKAEELRRRKELGY